MRVLFFVGLFHILLSNAFSQSLVNDFKNIEVGDDYKAYIIGTNDLANGKFVGSVIGWDRHNYHQCESEPIWIISHFIQRIATLIVRAEFEDGIPSGIWILEDSLNTLCGYISFEGGKVNGICMLQCPHSKRREIMHYQNDTCILRLVYDQFGDTLMYGTPKGLEIRRSKLQWELSNKRNWCDDEKLGTY